MHASRFKARQVFRYVPLSGINIMDAVGIYPNQAILKLGPGGLTSS